MPRQLTLLAVHAHPDDESLGTGGTLARYAAAGVQTILVCATQGEEGEVLNPALAPEEIPEDMAKLRLRELDAALRFLGVRRLYFLRYRDSGMQGRPSNFHPEALMNADLREATERLVRVIRETRPQVVITYNEKGLYGHPDHIAVNRVTRSAVAAAGDASQFADLPWPPWRPQKLYYTAIPRSRLLHVKRLQREKGQEFDLDVDLLGTADEAITTRVDVRAFLEQKLKAIHSHRSQIGPRSFVARIDERMREEALGIECYVCVEGCRAELLPEDDLFSGIRARNGS